jgi:hypothetical protein
MSADSGAEALANARRVHTYPAGYCLKYVRAEAWQIGGLYGSAIDAWHGAVNRHPGDRTAPVGAPLFYSGGQYGHIVINTEAPKYMRGTDMPSTGEVSESDIDWPVRHWGQTYLGWAEDLNGVDLPIGDDEMTNEDWQKLRTIVAEEIEKNNPPLVDKVWNEEATVTKPDGTDDKKSTRQILRENWQRIAKMAR